MISNNYHLVFRNMSAAIPTTTTALRPSRDSSGVFRSFECSLFRSGAQPVRNSNSNRRKSFRAVRMGSSSSNQRKPERSSAESGDDTMDYSSITDAEWKERLTKEQFHITRQKGTERAFTGEHWNTKTPGTYHCVCCDASLFHSSTKFDSGTGWPSYYAPIGDNVRSKLDMSIIFMPRQEVVCAACNAHLGHAFDDGPQPTGKRFCINSGSLELRPQQ